MLSAIVGLMLFGQMNKQDNIFPHKFLSIKLFSLLTYMAQMESSISCCQAIGPNGYHTCFTNAYQEYILIYDLVTIFISYIT